MPLTHTANTLTWTTPVTRTYHTGNWLMNAEPARIDHYIHTATGHNRFRREYNNRVEYWLHDTCIVTRWKNGNHITLNTGGYNTATTRNAMRDVICDCNLLVTIRTVGTRSANVHYRTGAGPARVPLVDGITIECGEVFR